MEFMSLFHTSDIPKLLFVLSSFGHHPLTDGWHLLTAHLGSRLFIQLPSDAKAASGSGVEG